MSPIMSIVLRAFPMPIRVLPLCAAVCACSGAAVPPSPDHFPANPFVTALSASGGLRVDARGSPQPLARGTNDVQLTVVDASSGALRSDLAIAVEPWMPAMNHGSSVAPTVVPRGDGTYLVTEVDLFMPGHWELRMSLSGSTPDHAVIAVDIP
jgi:hypothetical protein